MRPNQSDLSIHALCQVWCSYESWFCMAWGAAAGMQAPMLKDNVTGRPGQLLMATGIQESIVRGRALVESWARGTCGTPCLGVS